jgi:hypothetical protein
MKAGSVGLTLAVLLAGGLSASAGFLDGLFGSASQSWQGVWGIEGRSPVVTVNAFGLSYEGSDRKAYPVSDVTFTADKVTFKVDAISISLNKRADDEIEMVSTVGQHASSPIVLCKSDSARCRETTQ